MERGRKLYLRLSPFRLLSKATGVAALVKAGLERIGLAGGPVRPPLPQLTEEHRARLEAILADLGVR